jgi:hypothetical protein
MYDPLRSLLTCGAISSALALILLLEGFQSGLLIQLKNVALNRGADLPAVRCFLNSAVNGSRPWMASSRRTPSLWCR